MSNMLLEISGKIGEMELSETREPERSFRVLLAEHAQIQECFAAAIEEKEMLRQLSEEPGVLGAAEVMGLDLEISTLMAALDHIERTILRYDTDVPNDVVVKLELLSLLIQDGVEFCPQIVSALAQQSATVIAKLFHGGATILQD